MNLAEKKLKLLSFGARIDRNTREGRKSGAGPAGGASFELETGSVINLPLWTRETEKSIFHLKEIQGEYYIFTNINEKYLKLKKIPEPNFYKLKTIDGYPMKKVALLHGKDCLATTVFQRCVYWRSNLRCSFCAIELSLEHEDTTSRKTNQQLLEVIEAGIKEGIIKHCTFTTGTLKNRS